MTVESPGAACSVMMVAGWVVPTSIVHHDKDGYHGTISIVDKNHPDPCGSQSCFGFSRVIARTVGGSHKESRQLGNDNRSAGPDPIAGERCRTDETTGNKSDAGSNGGK